ncbi:MAG: FAD-dependent oxidoreductase [Solirubrobacterales bacterium]|nr:FAD-dependent oxidoreductase [Solirubrobacterales bacterium]
MSARESFDVVVVGSGSAGAVIARRLVEADLQVLLLEAGATDSNPDIHEPSALFALWDGPEDWGYRTTAQAGCAGRELHWPRGRVLGGSSALNGMIYVRGNRADYDGWAAAGNPGWTYDEVLPLFRRSEDFDGGSDVFHGAGGPMRVISRYEPHPVTAAAVTAASEAGIPFNADANGEHQEGVGFCQLTIKDGRRHSTAQAFLTPIADHPNLTVWTGARARRLLFEGARCTGVELDRDGALTSVHAEHEVVVCAGTIESPRLLMQSGIGPAEQLRALGIQTRSALDGVGENLQDHLLVPVIYGAERPVPTVSAGMQQLHGQLFWRSRSDVEGPDIQPLFFHMPMTPPDLAPPPGDNGFTLMAGLVRPSSRGRITLTGADPDAPLRIDPALLSRGIDVETLVFAVELCREIGRQDALAEWESWEVHPGPAVRSRDELRRYVREQAVTYHHQVGTCRMGPAGDPGAVVDAELRVHGVEGLRVADASIMPQVPTGNTHAPTVMIGERAAELIGSAAGRAGRFTVRESAAT